MANKLIQNDVPSLVRKAENDYVNGTTSISKYVEFSQYENIEKIDAYLNSKHTSGDQDSQGRDKPFFNIVSAATNIWYRATDIDRKHIRIKSPQAKNFRKSQLASIELKEWMRDSGFGSFLNEWGRGLAKYGSIVSKFVEKDGELTASVIPWNRLIVDAVDFDAGPKIEILYYTPAQLKKNKAYDKEMVDSLLDSLESRELMGKQRKDNKSEYIKVYEVHGELPLSYLTDKEKDEDTYVQQMHVISFVGSKKKGEFDDFTLYKGKESKDPYFIAHLIKEDGRTQSIGAVEYLFDAQWMVNHTAKAIKDQLDLASKLIFQTSDGNFVGRNVLTQMETGDILIHEANAPLTQANTASHDITSLQSYSVQWQTLAKEISSTPDAIRGDTMPSGTAWRQVEALRQESHSLFELMTENKGLAIEDMIRKYVLDFLKKKLKKAHTLTSNFTKEELDRIDADYIKWLVEEQLIEKGLAVRDEDGALELTGAGIIDPMQLEAEKQMAKEQLMGTGTKRFLDVPDGFYDDLEMDVEVEVTNEATDKDSILTTLSTVLKTIAPNPMILQDKNVAMIFNRILEETGAMSPVELVEQQAQPQMVPQGQPMTPESVQEEINFVP